MIRLWRDSTAPRRLGRVSGEQRRLGSALLKDDALLEAEADLVRSAWRRTNRISPF